MKSNLLVLALLAGALPATPALANQCGWTVTPNISAPTAKSESAWFFGGVVGWSWKWQCNVDYHYLWSTMGGSAQLYTINKSKSASGNATFTVMQTAFCTRPVEDIEATARNEFKADAELDDSNSTKAQGHMRIQASKVGGKSGRLDCHSRGGAEATDSPHGTGTSGTVSVSWGPIGASLTMPLAWSTGGSASDVFQDTDAGTGGKSPEVFTFQTALSNTISIGSWMDTGSCSISDSKSELIVWGTCDGDCQVIRVVIYDVCGY